MKGAKQMGSSTKQISSIEYNGPYTISQTYISGQSITYTIPINVDMEEIFRESKTLNETNHPIGTKKEDAFIDKTYLLPF